MVTPKKKTSGTTGAERRRRALEAERLAKETVLDNNVEVKEPEPAPAVTAAPTQKTVREAMAMPAENDQSVKRLLAHPDYDYVKVEDVLIGVKGVNQRDVAWYRGQGYQKVDVTMREDQDLELEHPDGQVEQIRFGLVLMMRKKSIGQIEAERQSRMNNPPRHDPKDIARQNDPGGHVYQEPRPIKRGNIGDALMSESELREETSVPDETLASFADNPNAVEALARIHRAADQDNLAD